MLSYLTLLLLSCLLPAAESVTNFYKIASVCTGDVIFYFILFYFFPALTAECPSDTILSNFSDSPCVS